MVIKKVWVNKSRNQKLVTIPKDEIDIQGGDFVRIELYKKEEDIVNQ